MDLKQLLLGTQNRKPSAAPKAPGSTEGWLPVRDIRNGVVLLRDGRFIKIVEVLPVNFLLKSPAEQANIIFYYAAYLKIAPDRLQICIQTQSPDISAYTQRMRECQQREENEKCREMNEDTIREVKYLAGESTHKRLFLVYQLEPRMKLRAPTMQGVADRMLEEEQTARRYLELCGLEVTQPDYADNFLMNTLYEILNPRTAKSNPLTREVFDALSPLAGVTQEELAGAAAEIAQEPEDFSTEAEEPVEDFQEEPEPDFSASGADCAWNVGPIPRMPKKRRRVKKRTPRPKRREKAAPAGEDVVSPGSLDVADILACGALDLRHRDYIVADGVYRSYLYIAGYGYDSVIGNGWLAPLIEAGRGIDVMFYMLRQPRAKILSHIAQTTMMNRSRMRDVGVARQDFEELDSAIAAGLYLKEKMNREGEDFYYMVTLIGASARTPEELERRVAQVETLCTSMGMTARRCDYEQEKAYLSSLPLLTLDPSIERKGRRNILTTSLARSFPFSSYQICDEKGVVLGINLHNSSLCMIDPFDSSKYESPHISVLGMTGGGKTMFLQCLAMRFREQGVKVIIIAPQKGFEYRPACEALGGRYIKLAPSSPDCLNLMDIWRTSLDPDAGIRGLETRSDSLLAAKISVLHAFFSLRKPDMTEEDKNLLDAAIVRCYGKFGITHDNASLCRADGSRKPMPTFRDLYEVLEGEDATRHLAVLLLRLVKGSARSLGGQTNVDLDNDYIVIDISDIGKDLQAEGMLIATEFGYDCCKEQRTRKKVFVCDELWTLIGSGSTRVAADYVIEMVKLLRSYGSCFVNATQDLEDYFALDDGKYGQAILNACRIKVIFPLVEKEALRVQRELDLSDEETLQIMRNRRGEALLCAGQNRINVAIRPSEKEYELITTSREDLVRQEQRRREMQEETT